MRSGKTLAIAALLVALPAASVLAVLSRQAPSAQARSKTPSFITYQLGATTGESCPNTTTPCHNGAAEPAIRADGAGNFYASSENGLGAGTDAWKSSDGGAHYVTLPSPNAVSSANDSGFAPGGGDTDLATAPAKNSAGFYNVYVASLSLANVDVSTSMDGGQSFTLNPAGATISGDDREWIAADGASKVCISYHDVATFNIDVNCSFDAGLAFTQLGDAIDSNHAYNIDANEIGNLAIDPHNHYIYQTYSGGTLADSINPNPTGHHVVYMAVSTDGGQTFTDYPVYTNPNVTADYGHQFVNVSIDSAGNVYSVYNDNHNLFYSYSTTHGQTWSVPRQINSGASATAIFPWSVAGNAGKLDVVWYGTSYYDGTNPPDSYPASAAWYVYFAQNLSATSGGSFSQTQATPIVHYGGVCEGGISCTGNRDLYDDFGVAASPTTGLASIVYSDDQYDPAQPTGCTQAQTNTGSCDHTNFATQTAGPVIYSGR